MKLPDWLRRVFGAGPSTEAPPEQPASDAPSASLTLGSGFFEAMLADTAFLARFPQYAGVLSRMEPVGTTAIRVAAVALRRPDLAGSRLLLLWNVAYFEAHPEHRSGVLLHEIQHVVCGHLDDPTFHRVAYPRLMEVAMELSANEPIVDPLPEHGFQLAAFARYGITPGQSTRERYVLLRTAYESGELHPSQIWSPRSVDSHRPRALGATGTGIGDVLDARSDGADENNWTGSSLGLGRPSSKAQLDRMKRAIAEHLRGDRGGLDDDAGGSQRRLAKELDRFVRHDGTSSELDWRRILREAFPRKRSVRADYMRPNRRFPARVGEIPGRRRRPPRPRLVVAIDTSGSMHGTALAKVVREVWRLAPLASITVVECDAAVHRVYRLGARPTVVVGGGDTDLGPVFDELGALGDVEGLVYFTDGKGSLPAMPSHVPTVWALTHEDPFLADFGSIVRIPD